MKVSQIEQQEESKAIRFTLNKDMQLVVDLDLPSGKEQVVLTVDSTDLLRIMLYEAYKSKTGKISKQEKSARNKALWALAKMEGKKKPDVVTTQRFELMTERVKVYEDEIEEFTLPDEADFMKRFDESLQKGIDELFGR